MNRVEYISELEARLEKLPRGEREDAVRYYSDYFNEAGPQMEIAAMDELGPPSKVAAQILAEYTSGYVLAPPAAGKKPPGKGPGLGAITLGILAAPVALPLALSAVAILFALIVAAAAAAFSFITAAFALLASGVLSAGVGIYYLNFEFATGLMAIGAGLATAGLGILLFIPTVRLIRASGAFILRSAAKLFNKINAGKKERGEAAYEKIQ